MSDENVYVRLPLSQWEAKQKLEEQLEQATSRYERLRAQVVEVLDSEIGDDVVALRRLLEDALDRPTRSGDVDTIRQVLDARCDCPEAHFVNRCANCIALDALDRLVAERDAGTEALVREWLRMHEQRQRAEAAEAERDELRARLQQHEQQADTGGAGGASGTAASHPRALENAALALAQSAEDVDDNIMGNGLAHRRDRLRFNIGVVRRLVERDRAARSGGASGASSTAAIPGPDPGACPECGEWRKAGILHECSTGSARPPGADRNIEHLGTPVGIARLKQAHSGIRDSWFEQPWVIESPTHGHPVYRQSQDEECFFCAVIAGWEHAEARVALLEEALRGLLNEVDCRIEHGAESGGHLEYVRKRLAAALDGVEPPESEPEFIEAMDHVEIPIDVLIQQACFSEAFAARMYGDNPDLPAEAVKAYRWAEKQFVRIANKEVGEQDIIS